MSFVLREDDERPCPPVVRNVLLKNGWELYDENTPSDQQPRPNLYWKVNRFYPSQIQQCEYPYQRCNHYPKSSEITKKDGLYRHMKRMKTVHGQLFSFVPETFLLPNEYVKFCQYYAEQRDLAAGKSPLYIVKPSDLSRGRKIFVFDDIGELTYDCSSVVQKYVARPLLIRGHKVDFRIYVLVTNFQPLRAYIFTDFLTRFGGEEYTTDVKDTFVHLTNYSVTKTAPTETLLKNGIGETCKWDGEHTWRFFKEAGVDFTHMWTRIETVVICTLLSICHLVPPVPQCFELYGFDVLFDDTFQPWLIEANFSPALAVESTVDETVKNALIADIVRTLNIQPFPGEGDLQGQPSATLSSAGAVEKVAKEASGSSAIAPSATAGKSSGSTRRPPLPASSRARSNSSTASPLTPPEAVAQKKPTRSPSQTQLGSISGRDKNPRGAMAPTASSSNNSSSSTSSQQRKVELIDQPAGKFKYVFPFSPETEAISRTMFNGGQQNEQALRQLLAEVKKRDAKAVAAMKDYPSVYAAASEKKAAASRDAAA